MEYNDRKGPFKLNVLKIVQLHILFNNLRFC